MRHLFIHLLTCSLIVGFLLPETFAQPRASTPDILIRNATVLTVTRGALPNADVLIRNGKISAVGKNLNAGNARVIDATGKYLMP